MSEKTYVYGQCAKCHLGATHFNDTVEVSIANEPVPDPLALSYDGINPPVYEGTPGSFDTAKTCFNTRCHLQRSPRWSCPGDE
jgi:hypothetical protein